MPLEFKSSLDDSAYQATIRRMMSETQKAAEKIEFNFATIGDRLKAIGIAGVAGFGFAVKGAVDFGSAIRDSSDALELSTESFQGFVGVLEQSGVSQEKFESGMVRLKKAIEDAKAGNIELVNTFEKMGVSWDTLSGGSLSEVLQAIASGLNNASDAGAAFNAATDIFGKGSQKFVAALRENGSELQENTKLVSKLTDEQIGKLDDLGDAYSRLSRKVKVEGSGFFSRLATAIEMFRGEDPESFADSARVYTPNPFGSKSVQATEPDKFAGLKSLTGPKDPRTVAAEKQLDENLEKANRESESFHEANVKAHDDQERASYKLSKEMEDLAHDFHVRAELMKREIREAKIRSLVEQREGLKDFRAGEVGANVAFNLSSTDDRRSAFRALQRQNRAENRTNRALAAANDPSRRFKDARSFNRDLGGDLNAVVIADKSIQKLTTEIGKLIVAP